MPSGRIVVAGQFVVVPEGYTNIRRVIRQLRDVKQNNNGQLVNIGLRKLASILADQYPQEWNWLNRPANKDTYDEVISWLRADPQRIKRAIKKPEWFANRVRKYVQAKNGR